MNHDNKPIRFLNYSDLVVLTGRRLVEDGLKSGDTVDKDVWQANKTIPERIAEVKKTLEIIQQEMNIIPLFSFGDFVFLTRERMLPADWDTGSRMVPFSDFIDEVGKTADEFIRLLDIQPVLPTESTPDLKPTAPEPTPEPEPEPTPEEEPEPEKEQEEEIIITKEDMKISPSEMLKKFREASGLGRKTPIGEEGE